MNERIKELENQCYGYASLHDDTIVFDKEKFAELIVQECIDIAKRADNTQPMEYAYIEIAKHFGIKGVDNE